MKAAKSRAGFSALPPRRAKMPLMGHMLVFFILEIAVLVVVAFAFFSNLNDVLHAAAEGMPPPAAVYGLMAARLLELALLATVLHRFYTRRAGFKGWFIGCTVFQLAMAVGQIALFFTTFMPEGYFRYCFSIENGLISLFFSLFMLIFWLIKFSRSASYAARFKPADAPVRLRQPELDPKAHAKKAENRKHFNIVD